MPSSYTTNLRLVLPVTGELSGSWGDTVNTGLTSLTDDSIAGTASITMTDTDYTLTIANGAADESRKMFVVLTGTLTAARNVICPANSKLYFVTNNTTGGFAINFKTSTGTSVSVANGSSQALRASSTGVVVGVTQPTGTVSTVSVVSANGLAGTVANPTTTPAITLTTSVTGVLKGNGTTISAATAGTDYLAPPSGTAMLKAASGGALANATAGTDYLAPPSGTAMLKAASGGALANAVAETDYVTPTGAGTLTHKTLTTPVVNGYTEGVTVANSTTTYTFGTNAVFLITLTGNVTYTFPTAAAGTSFVLYQLQDATGSRTATWPGTVKWPSATAPTLTSTASKADKFVFTCFDGANWVGAVAGQNY